MASELYTMLEAKHHNLANDLWEKLGAGFDSCQNLDGANFVKYPSGVVGIYTEASPEGLKHAVFNEDGELVSLMSGNDIIAKDGDRYLHVDSVNPSPRVTNAEDSMIFDIYDAVKQCSLEYAR